MGSAKHLGILIQELKRHDGITEILGAKGDRLRLRDAHRFPPGSNIVLFNCLGPVNAPSILTSVIHTDLCAAELTLCASIPEIQPLGIGIFPHETGWYAMHSDYYEKLT